MYQIRTIKDGVPNWHIGHLYDAIDSEIWPDDGDHQVVTAYEIEEGSSFDDALDYHISFKKCCDNPKLQRESNLTRVTIYECKHCYKYVAVRGDGLVYTIEIDA